MRGGTGNKLRRVKSLPKNAVKSDADLLGRSVHFAARHVILVYMMRTTKYALSVMECYTINAL